MNLSDKKTIINLLHKYNLWSKKSLGQNFLVDKNVLKKIIKTAELSTSDTVLEIGPGLGVLSQNLCQNSGKVIAIEKDDKIFQTLMQITKEFSNLVLINQDILKFQTSKIKNYKIVANLPYNITAPVLKKFLTNKNKPKLIVLMVQKEVAKRICAQPGQMSILAIMVQIYGRPKIIEIVKSSSFFPIPKVDSAILRIGHINNKITVDEEDFFRCVKIGFSSRRKTLLNNLSAGYRIEKNKVKEFIKKIGLKEKVRAQELSIDKWQELVNLIR